jgi:hypothetical protein
LNAFASNVMLTGVVPAPRVADRTSVALETRPAILPARRWDSVSDSDSESTHQFALY